MTRVGGPRRHPVLASAAILCALAVGAVDAGGQTIRRLSRPRAEITIAGAADARPSVAAMVASLRTGCAETVLAADVEQRLREALAAAFEAGASSGDVVITVVPRNANARCALTPEEQALLDFAAVDVVRSVPERSIVRAELIVDGTVVSPRTSLPTPVTVLAAGHPGGESFGTRAVFPIERLRGADGWLPLNAALMLWRRDEELGERVELPIELVEAMWRLTLPRSAALATPAAREAAERLAGAPTITRSDLPHAALLIATLAATADSARAHVLAASALRTEPCLRLGGTHPEAAQALLEQLRPPAHCSARALDHVAYRGLAVPGLGQVSSRARSIAGAVIFGAVLQRVVSSQMAKGDSRELYRAYQNAATIEDANRLYASADAARRRTDRHLMQAGVIWLAALGEAIWYEARLGRRLRFAAPIQLPD